MYQILIVANEMNYANALIARFSKNANAENAVFMKKYMRELFDFYGIKSPLRKDIQSKFLKEYGYPADSEMFETIRYFWNRQERECQYFAQELLSKLKKRKTEDFIFLYEEMICKKSWWDTVDFIAADLVGDYFLNFPHKRDEWVSKCIQSGNIWLQRSTLLFQLKYKKKTDTDLLYTLIDTLKDEKDFFIRKAIGWALRQLSRTNPEFVRELLRELSLSTLSVREAGKYL